ncbi:MULTISPECIES: hypothetical protein [Lacrimispora]|jgi:hypothetical protein|uniref:hypothetical protein n=1 Tax=Lacrimispora TaxID=2719231 RepID=UPI00140AB27F|nr:MULTISPECIES: hypothetical protein [Lacrimispora]MDR2024121.1 hypothetical protein [Hungatella sp.]
MLLIIYWIAGYWAVGRTVYANRIVFDTWGRIIIQKMTLALILGWLLIPIAIIKALLGK